ncbi:hypothetical protein [Blastochloris viridis]|uniref:Uncharacterized protein n=1 Tax=Blastochloris viridis TaxID=1079 RepID=A0A0H5BH53_BLAVI|nr:hypothetical protein [Blastochloris viridis]ALK09662.1 hypothetical protein BVIR_1889 [Blastochloris viridis]BAS00450.1 hypothetical protein BV133_2856 [Blastochloris viridis]CUU42325.1 hypothetical protein BVIRIDIS_13340 [Blastochloris viridis]
MTAHSAGHSHPSRGVVRMSPSLLRMSIAARLGVATVLVAAIWSAVLWAMT